MLQNTFIHFPRISQARERRLWTQGAHPWDEPDRVISELADTRQKELFGHRTELEQAIDQSCEALEKGDADYFATLLPSREHFRIALAFPEKTGFLDIETTGLSHYYDHTTVIGIGIGDEYKTHINGQGTEEIREFLAEAKCLVTFNGTIFDLRFLKNDYPEILLPKAHVDLRFFCKRVGLTGGQKIIEHGLGFSRSQEVAEVIGERAPALWHEYRLGDIEAARKLVQYNHADIEGMKWIFDAALDRIWNEEPIFQKFSRRHFAKLKSKITFTEKREGARKNQIFIPEFEGRMGPQVVYNDLMIDEKIRSLKVVGIDLTGSETRPTGWCFLHGNHAETCKLSTDDEIVLQTLDCKPDIVSIDSPLSLPAGRTKVTDDDPMRDEIGIMRQCERELKRRGVNVYPSLIQSMQNLTARGIRLAKRFRMMGLPTIESYPGAAQDILNIPRKGAGEAYLLKGLADFGIVGDFSHGNASHDELDALTSAIVGLFFWAGRFEALGNDEEEFLIIPDLNAPIPDDRRKLVVGFSGPISAGKTTAGKYLSTDKNFSYGRYSRVLKRCLEEKGEDVTRESLQCFGEHVNKHLGQRWLGFQLLEHVNRYDQIAIDGLRFPEDHAFWVERFGASFLHVHIEASELNRLKRYVSRGGTEEEFHHAKNHAVEGEVHSLAKLANYQLNNDVSLEEFITSLSMTLNGQRAIRGGALCL